MDLIFLFGSIDISHNPISGELGAEMRNRWICFINGEAPWAEVSTEARFAFGPYGECKELDGKQYASRRRLNAFKLLRELGVEVYGGISNKLAAGKMSLLN